MIKINVRNEYELKEWYNSKLNPIVISKCEKKLEEELSTLLCTKVEFSEKIIRDILTLGVEELCKKYSWINRYYNTVNIYNYYIDLKRYYQSENLKNKYQQFRLDYVKDYSDVFEDYGIILRKGYENSWDKTEEIIRQLSAKADDVNDAIGNIFCYDFMPSEVRQELVYRLSIPVCPYCNKQYIQSYKWQNSLRYLGDLDHIIPKDANPLFSLSLMNLVPSCKSCNQVLKSDKHKLLFNPYYEGFDEHVRLRLKYKDVESMIGLNDNMDMFWEYDSNLSIDKQIKARNAIEMFRLNETYNYHKSDIRILLRKMYKYSKAYINCVDDLMNDKSTDANFRLTVKEYIGVSLLPENFQNEVLSKAFYDVVFYN